jgi:imidazolonepropionase-like amidohydrolase
MKVFPGAISFVLAFSAAAVPAADVRSGDRLAFALVGGRVIAAPGRVIDPGVVVVRGGVIEAVGPSAGTRIPEDARRIDVSGKVVHAAFIDPYVPADRLAGRKPRSPLEEEEPEERREPPAARAAAGPADHPVVAFRARERVIDTLQVRERVAETYRKMGFGAVTAVPPTGVWRGRGAVVSLADGPISGRVIDAEVGQHVSLDPERLEPGTPSRYPSTKMGGAAVVRQGLLDALWWRDAEQAYTRAPVGQSRPRFVSSIAALVPAAEGKETVVFDTVDVLSLLRAARVAREFKLKARYVTAGDEHRLRDEVVRSGLDLVLRVDFPQPDKLEDDDEWLDVSLERLRAIDRAPSNPKWLREAGLSFSFTTAGLADPDAFTDRVREALGRGLTFDDALAAVTTVPARQLGLDGVLGSLDAGKIANLVVASRDPFAPEYVVAETWIDGRRIEIPEKKKEGGAAREPKDPPKETPKEVRAAPVRDDGPLASPKAVVVRGATLWTQGPAGILEGADLVAVDGRIVAVGKGVAAPADALVIDAAGRHVTPGIIDAHSHSGVDQTVNEGVPNVSAEVRIRDVLDPFDIAIYRELAGGTTVANVLHGSANAIGGQNAIVKWRRGGGPDDLLLAGAPEGIKFALGENPKRASYTGANPRYPASRLGVANLIRERFLAARDYRRRHTEYVALPRDRRATAVPPRSDLQLEAIAEVLEGRRQIHCHAYRADEILEMIRVADEFGVRIGTFQHVLEGYKVADEIARHGAGASCFSDWWAYKFEVIDAIPYAGALMRDRGALVSFNSDSDDLARRLNLEAAKAVKYGGVPAVDALALVTSNPARQLGIAHRVGSLEAGKDADFVIWSGDPLATSTLALETWIDGKKYFDREADLARRAAILQERADLVARAKQKLQKDRKPADGKPRDTAAPDPSPAEGPDAAPAAPAADRPPAAHSPERPPEDPERKPTEPPPAPRPTPRPSPTAPPTGGRS